LKYIEPNGSIFDLYLIEVDPDGDEINCLYHSIFKYKNHFYDINGNFNSIEKLCSNFPFYDTRYKIFLTPTIFKNELNLSTLDYKLQKLLIKFKKKNELLIIRAFLLKHKIYT